MIAVDRNLRLERKDRNMYIRTFYADRKNGDREALECLDEEVKEKLGCTVVMHSVTDTRYGDVDRSAKNFFIARVVIFSFPSRGL